MQDVTLDHVRGLQGCSLFRMVRGRQPGGPILADGFEKVELVTAGRCWAKDGSSDVEATPGTIIWHLPGDRLISRSDEANPYHCLVITWIIDHAVKRRMPRFTRWDDLGAVGTYGRMLLRASTDERMDRRVLALASYAHLQMHAHLWSAAVGESGHPGPVQAVLAALGKDPARPWSVATMARLADCSPARLHAAFRSQVGTSPHQHLLELRLHLARELLATNGMGLAEVARRSGLGSAAVLCRRFRRHSGMTPGQWRERVLLAGASQPRL